MYKHSDTASLQRLHQLLSFELSTVVLLAAWFIIPHTLIILIIALAAAAVAPLLVRTLYRRGKWGWLIMFVVAVLIPLVLAIPSRTSLTAGYLLRMAPLVTLLCYCALLRHSVKLWIEEDRQTPAARCRDAASHG